VHTLVREGGERTGSFGRNGRNVADFHCVHNIAIYSQGRVYTAEVDTGKGALGAGPRAGIARETFSAGITALAWQRCLDQIRRVD
jgi:hypothetical protein